MQFINIFDGLPVIVGPGKRQAVVQDIMDLEVGNRNFIIEVDYLLHNALHLILSLILNELSLLHM